MPNSAFARSLERWWAALLVIAALSMITVAPAWAADHGDAPGNANDRQADLDDLYVFVAPDDSSRLVIIMTTQGFIVPGEAVNFGFFDHRLTYRFDLDTDGDPKAEENIQIKFTEKTTSGATPQQATIKSTFFPKISGATTTVARLAPTPNAFVVNTDPATGIRFFAGTVDDPFFFDIPGFARFVSQVNTNIGNGSPCPDRLTANGAAANLSRGRDSFAGYNTLAIALSIPLDLIPLKGSNTVLGISGRTIRGGKQIDREANPAINVALIPYPRKNEYNLSNPQQDAKGRFAGDIVATLQALCASGSAINALAGVAVVNGDFLRLDLASPGGGFPNGRRLSDDVIDIILSIIAGGPFGDSVPANDVSFTGTFPYLAPPQQPRGSGTLDDNTRN